MVYGKLSNHRAVARAMVSVCSISPFYPKAVNVIAKMNIDFRDLRTLCRFVFKE
jgi:hypothetical protein